MRCGPRSTGWLLGGRAHATPSHAPPTLRCVRNHFYINHHRSLCKSMLLLKQLKSYFGPTKFYEKQWSTFFPRHSPKRLIENGFSFCLRPPPWASLWICGKSVDGNRLRLNNIMSAGKLNFPCLYFMHKCFIIILLWQLRYCARYCAIWMLDLAVDEWFEEMCAEVKMPQLKVY